MKKKDLGKFKNKSITQLDKDIADLKSKTWDIRQEIFKGKEKNVRKASALKIDIAQLSTLKNIKIAQEEKSGENRNAKPVEKNQKTKLAKVGKSK